MHDEPDSDVWARWRRSLRMNWQRRVLSRVYRPWLDTGGWRGCVVLASSPRSGSTWVFEMLNQSREYRAIFEPFHPSRVPALRAARHREYRRPGERCPELEATFARLFAGELSNRWMDRFNRRWVSARRLVKTVRSNLVLPWLAERFPSMPLVLLLRHPCAVAASRKRLRWGTNVAPLLAQPKLCQDYLGPHLALMQSADTFEREIYRWAVSQLVPLSLLRRGQALVVFYEDLVRLPEQHSRVLFGYTRTPWPQAALVEARVPSALALRKDSSLGSTQSLSSWRHAFTSSQLERADRILQRFGLDVLYTTEDDLPKARSLAAERFPCLDFY